MKLSRLEKSTIDIMLWICVGAASIGLIYRLNDERVASLIAASVLAASILFSIRVLKLELLGLNILYLILLGAFHLGLALPWSLGVYEGELTLHLFQADLIPALVLIVMAVVSFQIGSSAAVRLQKKPPSSNVEWRENKTLFLAGIGLLAAAVAIYAWGSYQLFGEVFPDLTYMEHWQSLKTGDTWLYTFGAVFTPIGFYSALCGASRRQAKFVIAIVAIWGLSNLWVGGRSGPMLAAVTVLWVLKKKGASLSKRLLIAGLTCALLTISFIGVTRNVVPTARNQTITWAQLNPLDALAEMGTTIGVLAQSYRLVGPSQFRGGRTYVYAVRQVFPRKLFPDLAQNNADDLELSPAAWYVWTTELMFAKQYGGRGFSSIAEAYINFGEVGVCLVYLALGFFLVWLELQPSRGFYWLAACGIIFPRIAWSIRSDFSIMPRHVLWGLAFLAVVKLFSRFFVRSEGGTKHVSQGAFLRGSPSHIPRPQSGGNL